MIVEFNSSQRPERQYHLRLAPCVLGKPLLAGGFLSGTLRLAEPVCGRWTVIPLFLFSYLLGSHCSVFLCLQFRKLRNVLKVGK